MFCYSLKYLIPHKGRTYIQLLMLLYGYTWIKSETGRLRAINIPIIYIDNGYKKGLFIKSSLNTLLASINNDLITNCDLVIII